MNVEQLALLLLERRPTKKRWPPIFRTRSRAAAGPDHLLQRQIEALGAVNLAALEELESAKERKGYSRRAGGRPSRRWKSSKSAIRRIDRETRDLLQTTYDTVNRHFGELFPTLFGGGEAKLIATGDEILDSGVQVMAQLPGKKNSTIHLLSGGEKALSAIALVFAMFQLNPAPFCLLDEVDAPLDDSNTERFCKMVERMSANTQFLFINHNKIAMEMAKQLVGVTMQESGVSRIVEVDIDEALRIGSRWHERTAARPDRSRRGCRRRCRRLQQVAGASPSQRSPSSCLKRDHGDVLLAGRKRVSMSLRRNRNR